MSGKSREQIIHDLENHIYTNGGGYAEWYVGITDQPKHQLFTTHKLRTSGDAWISRRAVDDLAAIDVEEFFRTVKKTRGNPGKTTLDHVFVYAYRMKAHTKP